MASRGDYQAMHAEDGNERKDLKIEMMNKGTQYLSKAVTYNIDIPLQAQSRKADYIRLSRRASQGYGPEPCVLPALRWGFSILALVVLSFVLIMFVVMLYDVFTRSLRDKSSPSDN